MIKTRDLLFTAIVSILLLLPKDGEAKFLFVDSEFCPLVCDKNQTGRDGYLVDIIRDALKAEGLEVKFSIVPYKRALEMVRRGQAHGLPAIYHSDAPDLLVGKTVIAQGHNSFFVRSDDDWKYDGKGNWDKVRLAVLSGYTFGHTGFDAHISGSVVSGSVVSGSGRVQKVSGTDPYRRLLRMLLDKRVDVILDDAVFVQYAFSRLLAEGGKYRAGDIRSAGLLNSGRNVVAYSPQFPDESRMLMKIIDKFVAQLYATGNINSYVTPYGLAFEAGKFKLVN